MFRATPRLGWRAIAALVALAVELAPAPVSAGERRSSFDDMSPEIQAMQEDDFLNPGMLWVVEGEALWSEAVSTGPACAACHGEPASMAGAAARYPAWDDASGAPVDLEGRINLCRTRHQGAAPWPRESRPLLSLTALVANQSRGLPIAPPDDRRLAAARSEGEALWNARVGQLNLACAGCHDDHAGARLAASAIPQGHPTGYPLYRLEWQELGSLDRRFRNCMIGVRAEPYAPGGPESLALKAYLAIRAAGLAIESPAVRP